MATDPKLCPKCSPAPEGGLEPLQVDETEVDRCAGCGGIWFDKGELGPLLNHDTGKIRVLLGGSDPEALDQKTGACPIDQKRMIRVTSARNRHVVIETCPTCQGIWLDGGEFERIKRAQPNWRLGDLV
ncbi:MAG: zf-TFIIB domain-containing protein [Planctomycetes bacterium]|nr:zf-TFIIB domain-containing protein [Planctomycetota bacterium]